MTDKRLKSFLEDRLKRLESIKNERELTTAELGDIACCKQTLAFIDSLQEEPVSEPNKELAETYLAVFDKKFPVLPTLKGKQLADYKNFLNKCQQIFSLKEWGTHPIQSKLFEKLSLLWAVWGAEHLQGVGRQDEKEQDIPVSEELEEALAREWQGYNDRGAATVDALEDNTQELAFAKGFYRGAQWQKENLWKPADGDDLPEIDREVIALKDVVVPTATDSFCWHEVVFAHRPATEGYDGKSIVTGEVKHYTPETYDKGCWNIPNIKYWLDVELPKEIEL